MENDDSNSNFVDIETAAASTQLSRSTINRARASGELASYKFGKAVRISRKDLAIYIAQHKNA